MRLACRMKNVTFQCCDTVACDADQCEEQICLPDPDADVERGKRPIHRLP